MNAKLIGPAYLVGDHIVIVADNHARRVYWERGMGITYEDIGELTGAAVLKSPQEELVMLVKHWERGQAIPF